MGACWPCFDRLRGSTRRLVRIFRQSLEKLYEKVSTAGQPPRHEANHGSIYERFSARTQPLVIFTHPPVVVDPRKRPLHHPPARQHPEAWRRQQFLPIYRYALFSPFLRPRHQHLFGGGLTWVLDELGAPAQGFLYPVLALVLSSVAAVQPQMTEAGNCVSAPRSSALIPS
jgi:hypothetical protein